MESNNRRSEQTQSDQQPNNVEAGDWRSNLPYESRLEFINKILQSLKRHYPGQISKVYAAAINFEEEVYNVAPSLDDYMRLIAQPLQSVLRKQQQHPQQALVLQRQQVTHKSTRMPQSQQQTSQPPQLLMGQQKRLIAQEMVHKGSAFGLQRKMKGTWSSNSNMNPNQPHVNLVHQNKGPVQLRNQQSATNLLTNQGQHSQFPLMYQMQLESVQLRKHLDMNQQQLNVQQRLQPSGTPMQSPNFGDQNNQIYQPVQSVLWKQQHHPQQALILQRQQVTHKSTRMPQSQQQKRLIAQEMVHKGSTSVLQRKMKGTWSSNSDMNPHQPNVNLVHQNKGPVQLRKQQSATNLLTNQGQHSQSSLMSQMQLESVQLRKRKHLDMNQQHFDAQQRLQPSGTSMQSCNFGDQHNQIYQSQTGQPAVSSDSISQTGHASSGNWQEEVLAKITSLKDMFTDIQNMYQNVSYEQQQVGCLPQQANYDQLEKLREFKKKFWEIMACLAVNKCDVTPSHSETCPGYEKFVVDEIKSERLRTLKQGPSPVQSIQQVQSHTNHINPLIQSSNIKVPRVMEQKITSLQQNSVSSLCGASYAQVNMSDNVKLEPYVDAGQGSSGLAALQQGVDGSLQQNSVSSLCGASYAQVNMSDNVKLEPYVDAGHGSSGLASLQHGIDGSLQQQTNMNGVNLVQPNISDCQSTNSVNDQELQDTAGHTELTQTSNTATK